MSYIKEIPPERAEAKLAEVYKKINATRGQVANILQVSSIHPDALAAHFQLYRAIMFDGQSSLSRIDRELIATVVSQTNNCHY